MFYTARFKRALNLLGVNPIHLKSKCRIASILAGNTLGFSPQEAAVVTVSRFTTEDWCAVGFNPGVAARTIRMWVRKRKIDLNNPEILTAIVNLGLTASEVAERAGD
jgi:hypothetical protein